MGRNRHLRDGIKRLSVGPAQRIVVGHTGSLPANRRHQIDWAIQGRNVSYCDVTMLDALCETIRQEVDS